MADDFDLEDVIWEAMDNAQDMDVGLRDYARAVVKHLATYDVIAFDPLRDRLAAMSRIADELASPASDGASLTYKPLASYNMRWHATVFLPAWDLLSGYGSTPVAALDALEVQLRERDPARLEAEGWATLGVEPSAKVAP